ncbi:MAG TPA: chalcone isomerase family protein [Burkholderiaceae bacterium]|nr:chalcone isomerase family protein [Burkholderiaceae bacterium]
MYLLRSVLLAAAVSLAALAAQAQTVEVAGVKLEPAAQVGGQPLVLNGAGVRTRAFFKVYVAGLYVPQKSTEPKSLLAQKGPRRVAIHLLRDVDAETFAGALNDGLKANHSEEQLAAMKAQLETFNASMKSVGEVKKGDAVFLDLAGGGTQLIVNGQPRGAAIPGEEFFTALLRIWIGDQPADGALKKGMLGG